MTDTTPQICPRCRKANQCAVANRLPAQQCWCMQQPAVSELACPVPAGTYCLCAQCLQSFYKHHE